ncbi:MAG: hypothetical protein K5770_20175 [Lachnospiraceae bacterium]|nr:hypothetical protein [Lachnospiraceae bacterium]
MKKIAIMALIGILVAGAAIGGTQFMKHAEAKVKTESVENSSGNDSEDNGFTPDGNGQNKPEGNMPPDGNGMNGQGGPGMAPGGMDFDEITEEINELEAEDVKADLLQKLAKVQKLQKKEQTAMESLIKALEDAGIEVNNDRPEMPIGGNNGPQNNMASDNSNNNL